MKPYRVLLAGQALLFGLLASPLLAAPGGEGASRPTPPDERLKRPVDLSVSRVTLADALKALGTEAETPLACTDRGLTGRPVFLFIRKQSLGSVMHHLARFFPTAPGTCRWDRVTVEGQSGYRLVEDNSSRNARELALNRLRKSRRERLQAELEEAMRLTQLTPEEFQRVQDQHPEFWDSMSGLRVNYALLASLSPEETSRLLDGKGLNLPYSGLRPEQQRLVFQMVGDCTMSRPIPGREGEELSWSTRKDLPKSTVTLRITGSPERPGIRMSVPTLPGGSVGFPDMLHPGLPAEKEQPEWMRAVATKRREAAEKDREQARETARKDPDLLQKITLTAMVETPDPKQPGKSQKRYADLAMALEQVADRTGLSIVGDYDPCWDDYYSWQDFHMPGNRMKARLDKDMKDVAAWEALEAIAARFKVSWEKRGKFLWVRSPRVLYAMLDGIDLLDERPAPRPKFILDAIRERDEREGKPAPDEKKPAPPSPKQ
jgi:hypothetical protein